MDAKENARGLGGRRVSPVEMEPAQAHDANHAAHHSNRTPSIDAERLILAGLTMIPLHRWDEVDGRGRPKGKAPKDSGWQSRDYDSRKVIALAERDGLNVGVRLPPDWLVLDVDPRNFPEGRDSLAELVTDVRLDLSLCPHTLTGGGGHHYWFRKHADVQVLDSLPDYQGLEFKSYGRQIVAPGSIHPNGQRYEWDDLAPYPDEAPQLPDTLLRLIRRQTRAHGEAAGLGELTSEMLVTTLEQLDAENFQDHDEWLNLMMACHHATNGGGRQEFIDWSTQDPAYADHAWIIGRRWDSLHAATSRSGRPVTVKYLHKVVQAAGGHVARTEPEDDFDTWEEADNPGRGVDDAALREPPKLTGIDALVEELNEKHCVVMEGGKFRVFTEMFDPVVKRPFFQRSTKEDFQNLYLNQLVERANEKPTPKAHFWLKHPKRRQYHGIIFDPSREHEGWLNLWRGWAEQPIKGDWSLLRELIRDVLVDGVEEHFEYVLNWMAYMFQYPDRVAEVAICFKGKKGTGKGTLGRALSDLAGSHGLHVSAPEHITGRFNSHLQNCVCLFADEAFWAGDKEGESKLKQLVTEPTMTYEGKGRDAVKGKNLVHIVLASNSDWMVPAGLGDERRFAVFEVNESRRGDKEFFGRLNRQLDQGGRAAMLHDMLTRKLGEWAPRDSVPNSKALADQKIRGLDLEHEWWLSLIQAGERPSDDLDGVPPDDLTGCATIWDQPVRVLCVTLRDSYHAYAKEKRRSPKSDDALGRVLADLGVRRVQVGATRHRNKWCYVLPAFGQALDAMADALGVDPGRLSGRRD